MYTEGLGERLRGLRTMDKMTLAVVAERIGVTTSAIATYENGIRTPSVDVLIKLSRLFSVSVDYLLGLDNNDVMDVSGLTDEQKNTLKEMARICLRLNMALDTMKNMEYLEKMRTRQNKEDG